MAVDCKIEVSHLLFLKKSMHVTAKYATYALDKNTDIHNQENVFCSFWGFHDDIIYFKITQVCNMNQNYIFF